MYEIFRGFFKFRAMKSLKKERTATFCSTMAFVSIILKTNFKGYTECTEFRFLEKLNTGFNLQYIYTLHNHRLTGKMTSEGNN